MPELTSVIEAVRAQDGVDDLEFDQIYPDWARRLAERHFTPVAVARRAAELLVTSERTRVLDVGAGVGKFCLVGALTTPATFIGVEQRGHLVEVARATATRYDVHRAHFIHENLLSIDWSSFDAFYLFNPFYEHVGPFAMPLDDSIDLAPDLHDRYVGFTRSMLRDAPAGTRVATYHGFGGAMPPGYRRALREASGTDVLELWIKDAPDPPFLPHSRPQSSMPSAMPQTSAPAARDQLTPANGPPPADMRLQ